MHVFIANLHKDTAALGQQIPRYGQPVANITQIAVNAVPPGIAKGFDLFRLAGDVRRVAVFDIAAGGRPLKIGIEFDAVRRVEINALHLPRSPSRSASEPMTCRLSPRIMRFVQFWSWA